jgi:hypothetical protein
MGRPNAAPPRNRHQRPRAQRSVDYCLNGLFEDVDGGMVAFQIEMLARGHRADSL